MTTHTSTPQRRSTAALLAFVFPICCVLIMVAGLLLHGTFGVSAMPLFIALSGAGVGLALAYLIVSCSRVGRRPWWRSATSIVLALALMLISGSVLLVEGALWELSRTSPVELAERLEQAATEAALPAAEYLTKGETGTLVGLSWTAPGGKEFPIGISWARNDDGILVTSSLVGQVPKGQDGTPKVRQALRSGRLGFPLDYFLEESHKTDIIDQLFRNWLVMFNDLVADITDPLLKNIRKRSGTLPTAAEGQTLLASAKKRFKLDGSMDDTTKGIPIEFVIEKYTYTPGTKGDFEIACTWSCDIRKLLNDGEKVDSTEPAGGVLHLEFNAGGFLVMNYAQGKVVNPLAEVFQSAEDWSNRQAARNQQKSGTEAKRD